MEKKLTEHEVEVRNFFENIEAYVKARSRSDYDIAAIVNGRLRAFLELDIARAKDETPAMGNPFSKVAVINQELVDLVKSDGAVAHALESKLAELRDKVRAHWDHVKGTDDGNKLPMVNYFRQAIRELDLPDPGAVITRELLEKVGLYNGGTHDVHEDGESWKDGA